MSTFVLVHSPLVGPYTWEPVAHELRRAGHTVTVPHLTNDPDSPLSYIDQHRNAILSAYRTQVGREAAILVGHSGAGALLPYAGAALPKLNCYIFVDADLPQDNASRLDRFAPKDAKLFRRRAKKGYIPTPFWADEVLKTAIPDDEARSKFENELQPVPLKLYKERIPVPRHWPDAPCAYLHFAYSATYEEASRTARKNGWPYAELPGYHFQMLVDPRGVADALVSLSHHIHKGWRHKLWTK